MNQLLNVASCIFSFSFSQTLSPPLFLPAPPSSVHTYARIHARTPACTHTYMHAFPHFSFFSKAIFYINARIYMHTFQSVHCMHVSHMHSYTSIFRMRECRRTCISVLYILSQIFPLILSLSFSMFLRSFLSLSLFF